MFFLHFMLFPTFLETNNSGNKKNIYIFSKNNSFSLNVFFGFPQIVDHVDTR